MKLIDLYKEWTEAGKLCGAGLCSSVPDEYAEDFNLIAPDVWAYWGYNGSMIRPWDATKKQIYTFTPLRQTIVLLICAMNNEL